MAGKYLACAAALAAGALLGGAIVSVAGPLSPPGGPVASTYKTLSEVEPRIAVNATNTPGNTSAKFRITQPGSYYLTGNISGESGKDGIRVESPGVTLDLCGFDVIGVPGSLNGISTGSFFLENVVIRNGHVFSWGQSGVVGAIDIGRIEGITVAHNGAWGIDNGSSGTYTTHISGCEALMNGQGTPGSGGIRGGGTSLITGCVTFQNTGIGIKVGVASTVSGCNCSSNVGHGIDAGIYSVVVDNNCSQNNSSGSAGIHVSTSAVRIEGNTCVANGRGIHVESPGNFIARNVCKANTFANWEVVAGNVCLVVQGATGGPIVGNSGGAATGATDPNANFTF